MMNNSILKKLNSQLIKTGSIFKVCSYLTIVNILFVACNLDKPVEVLKNCSNEKSYPIQMRAKNVHEFDTLNIAFQNLEINLSNGKMIPLESEAGTTGMIIFSKGRFIHYNNTTIQQNEEHISSFVFIRFNPQDYKRIFNLSNTKNIRDSLVYKKGWDVIKQYFKHMYNNGYEAIIPDKGSYSIIIDDMLIEFDVKTTINKIQLLNDVEAK